MFRQHWRKPDFWLWWLREGAPREVRLLAAIVLLAGLISSGVVAADKLTPTGADTGTRSYVLQTTVQRVVTVKRRGKTIRKLVPVVKRIVVRPATRYETRTEVGTQLVTVAGQVRLIRQPVVRYVPRVRDRLITVAGKTHTVSETRFVPTTTIRTRTQTAVVTAERTVTDTQVQTRTVISPQTVTNTDTQYRTVTDTRTLTQTSPPVTVTNTQTLPAQTVTVIVTVTVPKPH